MFNNKPPVPRRLRGQRRLRGSYPPPRHPASRAGSIARRSLEGRLPSVNIAGSGSTVADRRKHYVARSHNLFRRGK